MASVNRFTLALLFILAFGSIAQACRTDLDCALGSRCLTPEFEIDGVCVGGMNPGNDNDRLPFRDPMDITGKIGSTCRFDIDCGADNICYKEGSIDGVCLPEDE